jgi:hypothetical protein
MSDFYTFSKEGERLSQLLREQAIEHDVICMQAPLIWDGDNPRDVQMAKEGCNGRPKTEDSEGLPPCPIRSLCLETAIELDARAGVWGGRTISDIMKLRRTRKLAALKKANQANKK